MSEIIDEHPEPNEIAHRDHPENDTVERLYRGGAGNRFYYYDRRLRDSIVRTEDLLVIDRDEARRRMREWGIPTMILMGS